MFIVHVSAGKLIMGSYSVHSQYSAVQFSAVQCSAVQCSVRLVQLYFYT